jgi:hypothetical protein
MKYPLRTSVLLLVFSFLCVEIAQARLLRTTGRGSLSRQFSETWYYVDNEFITPFGDATFNPSFGSSSGNSKSVGGGGPGVNAVPSDPCVASYAQQDVDFAIQDVNDNIDFLNNSFTDDDAANDLIQQEIDDLFDDLAQLESNFPFGNDPCVWEFEQGEDLFTFGSFGPFGNEDIGYDVQWRIVGDGVSETLAGAIQSGPNPVDASVQPGWVTLNAPAPASLVPGDYGLFVSVSLLAPLDFSGAPEGRFFYESSDPDRPISFREVCRIPDDDGPDVCGFNSVDDFTDEIVATPTTFFSEFAEILRILPSDSPPDEIPGQVPTPSTLTALLAGLLMLIRRRRVPGVAHRRS